VVHVQRTFPVHGTVPGVIDYLADFGHAEAWDPGTISCSREGSGPVQVGARWTNTSTFRGRRTVLRYRLAERSEHRLTFVGENKSAHSVDDLVVRDVGAGTEITYTADITFKGLARLADPFLRGTFETLADETAAQLSAVLSRL
jgi:carbon monoxide dehydrogenase subunit G